MANQVIARLKGDDYQHLLSWHYILELMMPEEKVHQVTIEDSSAEHVDDVTVRYETDVNKPDCFYQIKYHVDHRDAYSTEKLIVSPSQNSMSLLEKFFRTWNLLRRQDPERGIKLSLVSNWAWDPKDKIGSCIDGNDNSIKISEFFSAGERSSIGEARQRWQKALQASKEDFKAFISCLHFKCGFSCTEDLEKQIAERMRFLQLKSDETALLVAAGIVRDWITSGKQEIRLEDLKAVLEKHSLYLPKEVERCVHIHLFSIKSQMFDREPDYVLDWCQHFIGDEHKKGHQLKDPSAWNNLLLPELAELEAHIGQKTSCRLIKARGLARLSAWFAFGFFFSEVARYTIEIEQNNQFWRTDARPNTDFHLAITSDAGSPDGEVLDGEGSTVAVGISISSSLDKDVRAYLSNRTDPVAALLLLQPEHGTGQEALQGAGDAVALAGHAKNCLRDFVTQWQAKKLLLFYLGPMSGACFLGHRLNAVCSEIQIMEDQRPGYAPSFLLK